MWGVRSASLGLNPSTRLSPPVTVYVTLDLGLLPCKKGITVLHIRRLGRIKWDMDKSFQGSAECIERPLQQMLLCPFPLKSSSSSLKSSAFICYFISSLSLPLGAPQELPKPGKTPQPYENGLARRLPFSLHFEPHSSKIFIYALL